MYREATFHGPFQLGYSDGYAPLCIGSHYAVRTAAIREIGGIGPELAEDFSTSYQAANWIWAGYTKGRGKLDRNHQHALPVKDVYLYPLRPDYQRILTSR